MGAFEFFMFFYIPIGTALLNLWRTHLEGSHRWWQICYIFVAAAMAGLPMVYLRFTDSYTVFTMLLIGCAMFWFPIVGSRRIGS